MEKLHIISLTVPFGSYLAIEKTDYFADLNAKLEAWAKIAKPKAYRITNVSVQEITHQQVVLYAMFVAYEV